MLLAALSNENPINTNITEPITDRVVKIKFFLFLNIFLKLLLIENENLFHRNPIFSSQIFLPGLGALACINDAGTSLKAILTVINVIATDTITNKIPVIIPIGEFNCSGIPFISYTALYDL